MSHGRPPRLQAFDYTGMHRYFITCCTCDRAHAFDSPQIVESIASLLGESARRHDFSVFVYCFMPDHLHTLLLAETDSACLLECVRYFKQLSAYEYRKCRDRRLWQMGYFERVLRDDEESLTVARYILENPVRAGLAQTVGEYPFCGSSTFAIDEMVDLWRRQ